MRVKTTLSQRGLELAAPGGMLEKFKAILGDPYDPETNPNGFINMGTAENVCFLFLGVPPKLLHWLISSI